MATDPSWQQHEVEGARKGGEQLKEEPQVLCGPIFKSSVTGGSGIQGEPGEVCNSREATENHPSPDSKHTHGGQELYLSGSQSKVDKDWKEHS